jgi:hypothetical protein
VIPRTGGGWLLGGIGLTQGILRVLVPQEYSGFGRARCDGRPLVDDDMNGSDPGGLVLYPCGVIGRDCLDIKVLAPTSVSMMSVTKGGNCRRALVTAASVHWGPTTAR